MIERIIQSVVIAVLTYRRPDDIAVALPRLLAQAESAHISTTVLVIDNDPSGSAKDVVARFEAPNLIYANETHPGIAAARNRALAEAADFDLLVFIDDDEVPVDGWLNSLLDQHAVSGAAAIAGPVVSQYAAELTAWVSAGGFFDRRRLRSGTQLSVAATNNLLLDLHQIRALGLGFDERFGLSGGSDTLFTRQLIKCGARMEWCDDAIVIDRVPVERLSRSWVLRRALRSGNSWSRVSVQLANGPWERLRARIPLCAKGILRLGGGVARFTLGVAFRSEEHEAKGLRTVARGAGMTSGALGYIYSEYHRNG